MTQFAITFPQDKADFPSDIPPEPFLAPGDPAVTEIEEVPAQEQHKSLDTKARARTEVAELPRTVVVPSSPALEQLSPYKPQLCDRDALGYVATGFPQAQPPAEIPEPEVGIFSQDYTSPVPQLWEQQGAGTPQLWLLERIHLVLNSSQAFPAQESQRGSCPERPWEPSDVPEQMLVPQELLSCLRASSREPVDANTEWEGCSGGSWNWG